MDHRIGQLERQNKRLRLAMALAQGFAVLALIIAGLAIAMSWRTAGGPPIVRAEAFELWDGAGNLRAVLHMENNNRQVSFSLLDELGRPRAGMATAPAGPHLFLRDGQGKFLFLAPSSGASPPAAP